MVSRNIALAILITHNAVIAKEVSIDKSGALLGLTLPVNVELNHMYGDGGTLGGTITGSKENSLKFSYDGRRTFSAMLPWQRYHVFWGAHHPTDESAVELPICSEKEVAIFTLVINWINREYPQDWRNTEKWASTGYVVRFIEDMENRGCKSSK